LLCCFEFEPYYPRQEASCYVVLNSNLATDTLPCLVAAPLCGNNSDQKKFWSARNTTKYLTYINICTYVCNNSVRIICPSAPLHQWKPHCTFPTHPRTHESLNIPLIRRASTPSPAPGSSLAQMLFSERGDFMSIATPSAAPMHRTRGSTPS